MLLYHHYGAHFFSFSAFLQKLKTLRHPSILKFQWEQADSKELAVITEAARPLLPFLDLDSDPFRTPDVNEVCAGNFGSIVSCVPYMV